MRIIHLVAICTGAVACSYHPQPPTPAVDASGSIAQTYECAMRRLNELDYTVTSTDRASGFIRAHRQINTGMFGPDNQFDRLTVTTYPSQAGTTQLRVVAEMEREADVFPPTKDAVTARQDIVQHCRAGG